jgi:hypothetical protein
MQRLLFAAGAMSAAMASAALADEAFVGRWAVNPEVCASHSGETPANTALVATSTSLWWFDGYCRIGKMYKAQAVYVQAHCADKGDIAVTLDASGDRMKVTWGHNKAEDLKRCR